MLSPRNSDFSTTHIAQKQDAHDSPKLLDNTFEQHRWSSPTRTRAAQRFGGILDNLAKYEDKENEDRLIASGHSDEKEEPDEIEGLQAALDAADMLTDAGLRSEEITEEQELRAEALTLFARADYNGNGSLSHTEIKIEIREDRMLRMRLSATKWSQFFNEIDADGECT